MPQIRMKLLPGAYAVARLDAAATFPAWAEGAGFSSVSRTDDELSVVCLAVRVPPAVTQSGGWRCVKLIGPFAFDETGIVASVVAPLAAARIGVFVVSTFDGDHILVKDTDLAASTASWRSAGHRLE